MSREEILDEYKHNLRLAQERTRIQQDKHRTKRQFNVEDKVFLKLHAYQQLIVNKKDKIRNLHTSSLDPSGYYEALVHVAYKLDLSARSKLLPVFHVSLLKTKVGDSVLITPSLPGISDATIIQLEPVAILDFGWIKKESKFIEEAVVQWTTLPKEDHHGKTISN